MKYLDYKEHRKHGTPFFPFAYYRITPSHPRYNMPYHWHPEYEIIRVLSGTFLLTISEETYSLQIGDAVFITGSALHGGIPLDCTYECLVFDLEFFLKGNHIYQKEISSILNQELVIRTYYPKELIEIQEIFQNLLFSMSSLKKGCQFAVLGGIYQFLGLVLQHNYFDKKAFLSPKDKKRIALYKSVLSYIEAHYQEDVSLETLSACVGMNPHYFCKFFKEFTHQSPVEYLNYYRIECACEQLSSTDKNITSIALSCGFNDVSYFVKVFKKYKGVTPSVYLKGTLPK